MDKNRQDKYISKMELQGAGLFESKLGLFSNLGKFAWFSAAILILAFVIPLYKKAVPIAIVIAFAARILEQITAPQHFRRTSRQKNIGFFLMMGFYLLHVIGMFWTENFDYGMKDLEYKLSFLLFPLLFFPQATRDLLLWRKAGFLFLLGYGAYMLITITLSLIEFYQGSSWEVFSYMKLSRWAHPSYQAMYGAWAIFLVIRLYGGVLNLKRVLILIILLSFSVLLASKAGFISAILALIAGAVYLFREKRANLPRMLIIFGLMLSFLFALWSNPISASRLGASVQIIQDETPDDRAGNNKVESNQARLVAWEIAFEELLKNPLGVGTGDVKDHLVQSYREKGADNLAEKRLNPHNQFLQTGIALGFPGVLVLLTMLIIPVVFLLRKDRWGLAFFFLLIITNAMVESILEVQAGIVFFSFWAVLLINNIYSPEPEEATKDA